MTRRAVRAHPAHPYSARPKAGNRSAKGSPPASASRCTTPPPPVERRITHRQWLNGVVITEYYPAPERWFVGRRIAAPGLPGRHHVDWLYSARGLAMEGDGVDLRDHPAHIAALGSTGWVNAAGRPTLPVCLGKWSDGFPAWLRGGWRNVRGAVTYPLAAGGWSNGPGVRVLDYRGVTFAPGNSQPLRYYHSIAVDPKLIPEGSRVYIPAYRAISGGWFVAQDTGGAIRGRHIDVYRPAPATPDDLGRYMTHQRILVIPPA
ncbi:MAG TPA: 3D domain-containing protein [Solirubrobacteraceae bacterium]|nr:3D domain-containing protein [Solirubrobacteraceae bacterium]